jgi:RNase adaptor protein for sRNA GlmZ degradation
MSGFVGEYASSFSFDNDGGPKVDHATLVIDVRDAIKNKSYSSKADKQRHILRQGKALLLAAEKHLRQTPGGHVAFGCRLGHDRSVTMARELNRRIEETA